MKIAIIVGSIRQGRTGSSVGQWVKEQADGYESEATFDLLELADFDVPLLTEPTVPGAAKREYEDPKTRAWGRTIDQYDGFVFVTPEYNHGIPGAFKNAFDVIYPEWNHKPVGFVSYGADAGVRAVEHWRTVAANALMVGVRAQLSMSVFTDFHDGTFTPQDRRPGELETLFGQVTSMAKALAPLRG